MIRHGGTNGRGCLIGANALITEKMVVPDGSVVLGSPGKIVRTLDEAGRKRLLESAEHYREQGRRYRRGLKETGEGGS